MHNCEKPGPAAFRFRRRRAQGPSQVPRGAARPGRVPSGQNDSDGPTRTGFITSNQNIRPGRVPSGSQNDSDGPEPGQKEAADRRGRLGRARAESGSSQGPGPVASPVRVSFARPSLFRPPDLWGGGGGRALLTSPQNSRPPQSSRPLKAHVPSKLTPPSELTSPSEPPRGGAHRPGGRG